MFERWQKLFFSKDSSSFINLVWKGCTIMHFDFFYCVHNVMQDISYYCCIEVCGEHSNIISSLSPLFSPETGTFTYRSLMFICPGR